MKQIISTNNMDLMDSVGYSNKELYFTEEPLWLANFTSKATFKSAKLDIGDNNYDGLYKIIFTILWSIIYWEIMIYTIVN